MLTTKRGLCMMTGLSHDVGGVAMAYNPARETMTLAEVLL